MVPDDVRKVYKTIGRHAYQSYVSRRINHISMEFFLLSFSFFVFHLSALHVFVHVYSFILCVYTVGDSIIILFCSCWRLDQCHGMWQNFHAATLSACTNVRALRATANRSSIFTSWSVTPNWLGKSFFFSPIGTQNPCSTSLSQALGLLLCTFDYTPWLIWLVTPHRNAAVLLTHWGVILFVFAHLVIVPVPRCLVSRLCHVFRATLSLRYHIRTPAENTLRKITWDTIASGYPRLSKCLVRSFWYQWALH